MGSNGRRGQLVGWKCFAMLWFNHQLRGGVFAKGEFQHARQLESGRHVYMHPYGRPRK